MSARKALAPFAVKDCALVAMATGERAQNLRELRHLLQVIDVDSIYYHFWGSRLRPRFTDPEYHNDFAIWTANGLHDKVLAERLAVIDPNDFETMEALRQALIEVIEARLDELEYFPWARNDQQFEFIRSQIIIFDTRKTAVTPEQLAELIPGMSVGSIFFHFIDARRRNRSCLDDFQTWLAEAGDNYAGLCAAIGRIDPYFSTLAVLREALTSVFRKHIKEMTT